MNQKNKSIKETKAARVFADVFTDICLLYPGRTFRNRRVYWEKRIDLYANLSRPSQEEGWGTRRLEYISSLLTVLDSKFSTILGFLSLFGIFAQIWSNQQSPACVESLAGLLVWLSTFFWIFWVIAAFFCLRGVYRVAWNEPLDVNDEKERAATPEPDQVKSLIDSVIRRTAVYRVSMTLIFLCSAIFILLVLLSYKCVYQVDSPAYEAPICSPAEYKPGFGLQFPL